MGTLNFGQNIICDSITYPRSSFYTVVSSELFVGEDAAEAIRTYDPGAEVVVLSTIEEATLLVADRTDPVVTLVISPRATLTDSPLVSLLQERNGALMLLLTDLTEASVLACRTLTAELPFTNDTIRNLISQLSVPLPRI